MKWRVVHLGLFGCLLASGCLFSSSPYGPESVPYLDVSFDGRYLGGVTQEGELRVWDLETREVVFEPPRGKMPGLPGGPKIYFVTFWGGTDRVVWDCGPGRICWHDLESGEEGLLLEHDPQDYAMHGISSEDGKRMVFGTKGGRVFTFNTESGEQRTKKPRDVWTRGGADVIYTLEGTRSLDHFVSATSSITGAVGNMRRESSVVNWDEGYVEVSTTNARTFTDVLYRGITLWPWGHGEPRLIDDDFSDKVRADFSLDGEKLVIKQESGPSFFVYSLPDLEHLVDLTGPEYAFPTRGTRFLDPEGQYIGSAAYSRDSLAVVDTGETDDVMAKIVLRHQPAGGPRIMAALPEKGWVFIGLARGGIDWYRFRPGDPPRLDHIATLK